MSTCEVLIMLFYMRLLRKILKHVEYEIKVSLYSLICPFLNKNIISYP